MFGALYQSEEAEPDKTSCVRVVGTELLVSSVPFLASGCTILVSHDQNGTTTLNNAEADSASALFRVPCAFCVPRVPQGSPVFLSVHQGPPCAPGFQAHQYSFPGP